MEFRRINILMILSLSLILWSCSGGKKGAGSGTNFVLKVSGIIQGGTLSGGIIISGVKADGGDHFQMAYLNGSNIPSIELPTGGWNFFAVGWDGGSYPMEGTVKCGQTFTNVIDAQTEVELVMNTGNCAANGFADPAGMTGDQFKPIRLVSCLHLDGITTGNDTCAFTNDNKFFGANTGFRFVAKGHHLGGPGAGNLGTLMSKCVSNPVDLTMAEWVTNIRVPMKSQYFGFDIIGYDDPNCDEGDPIYHYGDGIGNPESDADAKIFYNNSTHTGHANLFIPDNYVGAGSTIFANHLVYLIDCGGSNCVNTATVNNQNNHGTMQSMVWETLGSTDFKSPHDLAKAADLTLSGEIQLFASTPGEAGNNIQFIVQDANNATINGVAFTFDHATHDNSTIVSNLNAVSGPSGVTATVMGSPGTMISSYLSTSETHNLDNGQDEEFRDRNVGDFHDIKTYLAAMGGILKRHGFNTCGSLMSGGSVNYLFKGSEGPENIQVVFGAGGKTSPSYYASGGATFDVNMKVFFDGVHETTFELNCPGGEGGNGYIKEFYFREKEVCDGTDSHCDDNDEEAYIDAGNNTTAKIETYEFHKHEYNGSQKEYKSFFRFHKTSAATWRAWETNADIDTGNASNNRFERIGYSGNASDTEMRQFDLGNTSNGTITFVTSPTTNDCFVNTTGGAGSCGTPVNEPAPAVPLPPGWSITDFSTDAINANIPTNLSPL